MEELSDDLGTYRWFHAMRGGLLQELGDHKAAIAAFETVLSLSPTVPEQAAIAEKIYISTKELSAM